jgi:hypothetical protein
MFSGSNSCLNKRAYWRLKESAYQMVNEADSLKDSPADWL